MNREEFEAAMATEYSTRGTRMELIVDYVATQVADEWFGILQNIPEGVSDSDQGMALVYDEFREGRIAGSDEVSTEQLDEAMEGVEVSTELIVKAAQHMLIARLAEIHAAVASEAVYSQF